MKRSRLNEEEARYLQLLKRRRQAVAARDDLIAFARFMKPDPDHPEDTDHSLYHVAKHHQAIAAALEQVEKGKIKRLIINVPPRHGKSELSSRLFPAWFLGRHPSESLILATYADKLSWDFGREVNGYLEDSLYSQIFPQLRIKTASVDRIETNDSGKVFFVGRGSAITGRGATGLLIDDPIKDRVEADSKITREKLFSWFNQVARTRLVSYSGWIVIIQCMTGDTPVLRPDGTETPLRDIRPGDEVATYRDGKLSTSTVRHWRSNGLSKIFTMKMISGIAVRANERHPFLVFANGEPKWIRLRDLRPGQEIFRVNGASGRAKSVNGKAAKSRLHAEAFAINITASSDGQRVFARLRTLTRNAICILSAATGSLLKTLSGYSLSRGASALSAGGPPTSLTYPHGGEGDFVSTIAMKRANSGDCFATTATWLPDTQATNRMPWRSQPTSDFILDRILEITPAGTEEVFDIQVDETENFVANMLVSHNTRWSEDDLVGRLTDPLNPSYSPIEGPKWKIIDLPAIAQENDRLGRREGEALWPERFPVGYLEEMRAADPRGFQSLYQGSPTPDKGNFFPAEKLITYKRGDLPDVNTLRFYAASDHAVSSRQERDKTCLLVVALDEDENLWVMPDAVWGRYPTDQIVERMIDLMDLHKPLHWWAERGHISRSIGPFLRKRMLERSVHCSVYEMTPVADKMSRAQSILGRVAMGKVFWPSYAPWWMEAQKELLQFPHGARDDLVDAISYIGLGLASQQPLKRKTPSAPEIRIGTLAWVKDQSRREKERSRSGGW